MKKHLSSYMPKIGEVSKKALCGNKGKNIAWIWMDIPDNACKKCLSISAKWPVIKN